MTLLTQTNNARLFYRRISIPVNKKLSEIFLKLHISEKSGRGVPKIIDIYDKGAFDFRENSILVNIPFNWINKRRIKHR